MTQAFLDIRVFLLIQLLYHKKHIRDSVLYPEGKRLKRNCLCRPKGQGYAVCLFFVPIPASSFLALPDMIAFHIPQQLPQGFSHDTR